MANLTVTFDPDKVMYLSDIARAAGLAEASALRHWMNRRTGRGDMPDPLFTLRMAGDNSLVVYSQESGLQIAQLYRNFRHTREKLKP